MTRLFAPSLIKSLAVRLPLAIILLGTVGGLLSGCAYDYLQHTDRVAYGAGDAVKANLEIATTNPSSGTQYDLSGLGQNGQVGEPATSDPAAPTP